MSARHSRNSTRRRTQAIYSGFLLSWPTICSARYGHKLGFRKRKILHVTAFLRFNAGFPLGCVVRRAELVHKTNQSSPYSRSVSGNRQGWKRIPKQVSPSTRIMSCMQASLIRSPTLRFHFFLRTFLVKSFPTHL